MTAGELRGLLADYGDDRTVNVRIPSENVAGPTWVIFPSIAGVVRDDNGAACIIIDAWYDTEER